MASDMASDTARIIAKARAAIPPAAWRMTFWGIATAVAIGAMMLSAISESGAQRLALAVDTLVGRPPVVVAHIQAPAAMPSPETTKLGEDLRQLTADRERLNSRLAKLETMLEDVTGSIKRQAELAAKPAPPPAPVPPPPTPTVSAPATVASPPLAAVLTPVEAQPQSAFVPLPRERVASLDNAGPDSSATLKTEIGIDLGGATTPEALKARWAGLKANLGPFLGPLQPVMVLRDAKPNSPPYRLILAPLPSQNAAVQVCARLAAMRAFCRPASFTNQEAAQL